jgi:hypothetical protein
MNVTTLRYVNQDSRRYEAPVFSPVKPSPMTATCPINAMKTIARSIEFMVAKIYITAKRSGGR